MVKKEEGISDVISFDEFKHEFANNSSGVSLNRTISHLLDKEKIDIISRIRDIELDKINKMYHHASQISLKMTLDLEKKELFSKGVDELKIVLCSHS